VVDEAVANSELAGWESLAGCYVYYTPTSGMPKAPHITGKRDPNFPQTETYLLMRGAAKSTAAWKTRKLVVEYKEFVGDGMCCVLEEARRKGAQQAGGGAGRAGDVSVRFKLVSELVFKVANTALDPVLNPGACVFLSQIKLLLLLLLLPPPPLQGSQYSSRPRPQPLLKTT